MFSMLMALGTVHPHPATRAGSPVLPRWGAGPILLRAAASEGQGQLSEEIFLNVFQVIGELSKQQELKGL